MKRRRGELAIIGLVVGLVTLTITAVGLLLFASLSAPFLSG
ncbi:hypothetical protein [Entomohabitans teleogrylli]|nr:hypothetical protein [Entomohabitans teleogrylli]